LSEELTQKIKALSQREGATLFMTLLAAFQTLLMRYSGQEHIVVGTPIANRTQAELEGLIGLFMNTLAMRGDLSGDPSFRELLARVKEGALGAYAHQDLPFEKLVEELQPERSLSHSPVFQVMMILQNAPRTTLEFEGVRLHSVGGEGVTAKFDLNLSLSESEGKLHGILEYNTDLFDAARIQRMLSHFQTLLEGIVADPDQRLSRLPLLTPAERQQVLLDWNDTAVAYPRERCLHELFEAQVERTPEAIALVCQDQSLTFQQLNARANQLAHYLRLLGVGPETLVGICLERSVEMVVGVLGILKAGGAYVPLDPSYPLDRLAFMIEDSRLRLLLTQVRLRERLEATGAQVVCLDSDWERIAAHSAVNLENLATGENLAYVLYTSGTTGTPKGAMIRHQGLTNYLIWSQRAYAPDSATGSPLHSSLAFDLTITSLFPSLLCGRAVHLLSEASGVEALGTAFAQAPDWSLVKITPAHLDLLSRQVHAEQAKGGTRAFVIGGEALLWEQVRFWRSRRLGFVCSTSMVRRRRWWAVVCTSATRRRPRLSRYRSVVRSPTRICMCWMPASSRFR
jgi:non-ribosomal peptide synthetase component F